MVRRSFVNAHHGQPTAIAVSAITHWRFFVRQAGTRRRGEVAALVAGNFRGRLADNTWMWRQLPSSKRSQPAQPMSGGSRKRPRYTV
jgi:hypothetical protein